MIEHPNVTIIRKAIEALNAGDRSAFPNILADDIVWHVPGNAPGAGTYRGKAEVLGFLQHLAQNSETPLHVDLLHLLTGGDDHVVAIWRAHATRKGWQYEGIAGYIFRMQDGHIVEARNLQEDQEAIDRFWDA